MNIKKEILKLAQSRDPFVNAVKKERKTYQGWAVYSCYFEENGEPVDRCTGLPWYILVNPDTQEMRIIEGDEALSIL